MAGQINRNLVWEFLSIQFFGCNIKQSYNVFVLNRVVSRMLMSWVLISDKIRAYVYRSQNVMFLKAPIVKRNKLKTTCNVMSNQIILLSDQNGTKSDITKIIIIPISTSKLSVLRTLSFNEVIDTDDYLNDMKRLVYIFWTHPCLMLNTDLIFPHFTSELRIHHVYSFTMWQPWTNF